MPMIFPWQFLGTEKGWIWEAHTHLVSTSTSWTHCLVFHISCSFGVHELPSMSCLCSMVPLDLGPIPQWRCHTSSQQLREGLLSTHSDHQMQRRVSVWMILCSSGMKQSIWTEDRTVVWQWIQVLQTLQVVSLLGSFVLGCFYQREAPSLGTSFRKREKERGTGRVKGKGAARTRRRRYSREAYWRQFLFYIILCV